MLSNGAVGEIFSLTSLSGFLSNFKRRSRETWFLQGGHWSWQMTFPWTLVLAGRRNGFSNGPIIHCPMKTIKGKLYSIEESSSSGEILLFSAGKTAYLSQHLVLCQKEASSDYVFWVSGWRGRGSGLPSQDLVLSLDLLSGLICYLVWAHILLP